MTETTNAAPFTYVHVPGCSCSAADYQERLAAERAALNAERGRDDADEVIPEGSCLGWMGRQEGWPFVHRDYHLMKRYREVAAARAAHETAEAAFKSAYSSLPSERAAELEPLRATRNAALEARVSAEAVMINAMKSASWGAQPDGTFVTRVTAHQIASRKYHYTLHAPAKGGPILEVLDGEPWYRDSSPRVIAVRSFAEARACREADRAANRETQAAYEAVRQEAGRRLRAGEALPYGSGQEYGHVCLDGEKEPRRVSAVGALTAAGLTKDDARALLDREWSRCGISYDYNDRFALRLTGLTERAPKKTEAKLGTLADVWSRSSRREQW